MKRSKVERREHEWREKELRGKGLIIIWWKRRKIT